MKKYGNAAQCQEEIQSIETDSQATLTGILKHSL